MHSPKTGLHNDAEQIELRIIILMTSGTLPCHITIVLPFFPFHYRFALQLATTHSVFSASMGSA